MRKIYKYKNYEILRVNDYVNDDSHHLYLLYSQGHVIDAYDSLESAIEFVDFLGKLKNESDRG